VFLLVPAHPGSPRQRAIKPLLLVVDSSVVKTLNKTCLCCKYHCSYSVLTVSSITEHSNNGLLQSVGRLVQLKSNRMYACDQE